MLSLHVWRAAAADQSGVTAIEYAFIASLIAIAATSVYIAIGSALTGIFTDVANGF
ncbi:MAG TPA: Flp family type IVb pilin [Stellaceae bacterium]|nr:Flp family type IVb pilin [Stellaceae bacterium]